MTGRLARMGLLRRIAFVGCLSFHFTAVLGEIRPLDFVLEPASKFVNYIDGFILAPGFIDLTKLHFFAVGGSIVPEYKLEDDDGQDGDPNDANPGDGAENESSGSDNPDGGTRARRKTRKTLGDVDVMTNTVVDIAVLHLPNNCSNTKSGCSWPDLGVGVTGGGGKNWYCCSNSAIEAGKCDNSQYGRLIMDPLLFPGTHRFISIPSSGNFDDTMRYGYFEEKNDDGRYIVIFANCNEEGRPIQVYGKAIWKSDHGFLPGDLFGLMYFLGILSVFYFILFIWYATQMRLYEEHTLDIQKWILGTIGAGLLETFFRAGDLFIWNEDGTRFWIAYFIGVLIEAVKIGGALCLLMMIALGWGVVTNDLGPNLRRIVFAGGLFTIVSIVRDTVAILAYTEVQRVSEEEEEELLDVVLVLGIVTAVIYVAFSLWVVDSLNATMEHLETMNQTSKLERYLRLRSVFLISILGAIVWFIFGLVNHSDGGIVEEEQEWVIAASMEMNFLFVLAGVAVLWRPNANAKDYAFVMELPVISGDNDGDEGEHGLELMMPDTVPSFLDDDDDDNDERPAQNGK